MLFEAALECGCSDEFIAELRSFVDRRFGALLRDADRVDNATMLARVQQLDAERTQSTLASDSQDARSEYVQHSLEHGWVPRGDIGDCAQCQLPFVFERSTWPSDRRTPLELLKAHYAGQRQQFRLESVIDPHNIGHRVWVALPELGDVSRVRVLRSFKRKQIASQNAALMALHTLHTL